MRIILLCFATLLSMLFVYVFSPAEKFLQISAPQCRHISIFFRMDFFFFNISSEGDELSSAPFHR